MIYKFWIQRIAFFVGIFGTIFLIYWNESQNQIIAPLTEAEVDKIINLAVQEAKKKSNSYLLLKPYQPSNSVKQIQKKSIENVEGKNSKLENDSIDDLDSGIAECDEMDNCEEIE